MGAYASKINRMRKPPSEATTDKAPKWTPKDLKLLGPGLQEHCGGARWVRDYAAKLSEGGRRDV